MTEFDRLKKALDRATEKLAKLQARYDQQQYVMRAIDDANIELRKEVNLLKGITHKQIFDWERPDGEPDPADEAEAA